LGRCLQWTDLMSFHPVIIGDRNEQRVELLKGILLDVFDRAVYVARGWDDFLSTLYDPHRAFDLAICDNTFPELIMVSWTTRITTINGFRYDLPFLGSVSMRFRTN